MRKPGSVEALETLGRVRLSNSFFMRDFLHSEIADFYGIPNIPDDPDLAIAAGKRLCEELLEPLQESFGRISIRSAFRSCEVNQRGVGRHNCASNESNFAHHIWDRRDAGGHMGATACIVVNSFIPYYEQTGDWQAMAWWVHDHLPYSSLAFFRTYAAFNINWHEKAVREIHSWIGGLSKKKLTGPGDQSHAGNHESAYAEWLRFRAP